MSWLGLNLTQWIIVAVIVGLIAYDVIALKIGQPTESMVLRDWGWRFSAFAFTAGFLGGHWFFPRQSQWVFGWMYALPIILGLLAWDIWWYVTKRERAWYRLPGIWFMVGIPAGSLLWTQISSESPIP